MVRFSDWKLLWRKRIVKQAATILCVCLCLGYVLNLCRYASCFGSSIPSSCRPLRAWRASWNSYPRFRNGISSTTQGIVRLSPGSHHLPCNRDVRCDHDAGVDQFQKAADLMDLKHTRALDSQRVEVLPKYERILNRVGTHDSSKQGELLGGVGVMCVDTQKRYRRAISQNLAEMEFALESCRLRNLRGELSEKSIDPLRGLLRTFGLYKNQAVQDALSLPDAVSGLCEFCDVEVLAGTGRQAKSGLYLRMGFVMLPIAGVVFLLALGVCLWSASHRRHRGKCPGEVIFCPEIKLFPTRSYSLTAEEIRRAIATSVSNGLNSFRIGRGPSSHVYKVALGDGRSCAVKILTTDRVYNRSFALVLQTLGRLRHGNLVKLLGYLMDLHTKALVLEFMPNGSLEKHLQKGMLQDLSWEKRLDIAMDIARALVYLHQECTPRIVHGNLTPSNIFLDINFRARVGDVGLERALERFSTQDAVHSSKRRLRPYVAPELQLDGQSTIMQLKLEEEPFMDVYSFGVILLELVRGKKGAATDGFHEEYGTSLLTSINKKSVSCQLEAVQSSEGLHEMTNDAPKEVISLCTELALLCMKPSPEDRPRMSDVLAMLLVHQKSSHTSHYE